MDPDYITRHWRGELGLGESFWINFLLLASVLNVIRYFLHDVLYANGIIAFEWLPPWIGVQTLVLIWQFVGVWRSAHKHWEKTGAWWEAIGASLAAVIVVIWFVTSVVGG